MYTASGSLFRHSSNVTVRCTGCTIPSLNPLHSSTCFDHYYAHLQEGLIVSIQHLVPDFVTLLRCTG